MAISNCGGDPVVSGDMSGIKNGSDFVREFKVEWKKMWNIAGPSIFVSVCHFSVAFVTQMLAGHLGTLDLAAVSIQNSAVASFSSGVLVGMGSALHTLCGQAYGAGKPEMMGVYLQRSCLILTATAILLVPLHIFAASLLKLFGIPQDISNLAGKFAIYLIPQLFANALSLPITAYLQSQSKIVVMAVASAATLALHALLSWVVMVKLQWGLIGAALVLNASYWVLTMVLIVYILGGACGRAWAGFSWAAFRNLGAYVRLSVLSGVMIFLEVWYMMGLVLFAGHLKNPKIALDGLSICMLISAWTIVVAVGSKVAASVRVSNELGAGHPRTAKFSVVVVIITSFVIGVILSLILIITRKQYPSAFTNSQDVKDLVYALTPLLAASIIVNNVQPVLSGVAVGAGWQGLVAYVNIGCYYVLGLPLGIILCYKLDLGAKGIWYGMLLGTVVQTLILIVMTYRTDWNKEASIAAERVKHWGQPKRIGNEVEKQTEM